MKEYLKMANYFHGQVSIDVSGFISDDKYSRGSTDIAEDYYEPICHAINSHDELVEMIGEVLDALKTIGVHTITDEDGDEVEVLFGNMRKIKEVIDKFE